MLKFDEEKSRQKLDQIKKKEEEEFIQTAANNRGLNYVNLATSPTDMDALRLLDEKTARNARVAVFSMLDKKLGVAIGNPEDPNTKQVISDLQAKGYVITPFLVSNASLEIAWQRYKGMSFASESKTGAFDISNDQITTIRSQVKTVSDVNKMCADILSDKKTTYRVTRLVEVILGGALALDASDIHIEPEEDTVRLRYRLDGVLNDIIDFDHPTYAYILSRLKLVAGLKINVRTEAQDGRFSIKIGEEEMEVRVSSLPGANEESMVMRLLNPNAIAVTMDKLGIEPFLLKIIEHELSKPTGMILNTGPTGSGKTTTLYAFLKKTHTPDVKVITIEDPIEYHLAGIVQTQTDPKQGYTFAKGLRAAMRQDPDIIMVGEIRDQETAEVAINASLTGHLVFSTLHTNSAAGAFPRLLSLGVNPKVLTSGINVAMAQRLVRKLCDCKKEIELQGEDKATVERIKNRIAIEDYKDVQMKSVWQAVGCEKCNKIGYKGRLGIYEAILASDEIEKLMLTNPSEREIKAAARKQNIPDMREDGVIKVLKGITSLDELRRVVDLDSE